MVDPSRVVLYPADVTACGAYRMLLPAAALANEGITVSCYPPGHPRRLQATVSTDPYGKDRVESVVDPEADVVVFQRPLSRLYFEALVKMKAQGTKIVVELDDDFRAVSPQHSAFRHVHPRYSPDSNWRWLDKSIAAADLLVASTANIARRYGKHVESVVVPNCVPAAYLDIERAPVGDKPRLGWPGTMESHPADLGVLKGSISEAMRATGTDMFRVIGPAAGVTVTIGAPVEATGWVPFDQYAIWVAALDVGIAPLEQSTFNDSKSWLKPLEFAALGIPCIGSDVAEYRRLQDEHGIGQVAAKPAQWRGMVKAWLSDHEARAAESVRLRAAVVSEGLTIEANAHRWWDAWTSVL